MEVDNEREVDEEGGDEVQNIQDLQLLERLRLGRDNEVKTTFLLKILLVMLT